VDSGLGIYRIGTVARLVGVEVATLRNWEQRYGLVVASRGPGGQRLFSERDIDRLQLVKHLIDGGLSAGEAHVLLRRQPQASEWGYLDRNRVRAEAQRVRAEAASTKVRAAAARAVAHRQRSELPDQRDRVQA
jgi:DNA-binding transcriptional MerR regulator